jgi:hypothetical protein
VEETPVPSGTEGEEIPVPSGTEGEETPVPSGTEGEETPVPSGTEGVGAVTPAAVLVAVAGWEARAELIDAASDTGQTVVVSAMVSVTTISEVEAEWRAGQSVMLAAQLVMVWTEVVKMVKVVNCPPAAEVAL